MICKWKIKRNKKFCICCFILTMWYVNNEQGILTIPEGYSFILTMWYVNYYYR